MKKHLLFCFFLLSLLITNAQHKSLIPLSLQNIQAEALKVLDGNEIPIIVSETNPFLKSKPVKDLGMEIGITWYDLQSNGNTSNRMLVTSDGSINAVWNMAMNGTVGAPDRGTGYNCSTNNGNTWGNYPTSRIEGSIRTGWPSFGKLPNNDIIVASHGNTPSQGNICKSTNGGLNWTNGSMGGATLGLTWCRMATNGNTIHVIGHTATTTAYQGFDKGALVYLKSTDGGTNWTSPVIPTGLDVANYSNTVGFNDKYSLAVKGDTIAIVYGDGFRTPCLVKSTNNGTTWAYREILHLPIQKFNTEGTAIYDINNDGQQDNVYCTDGCNYVVLDKFGKAHVFFGRMKYTDNGAGAGNQYFPYTDGIYYWNEDMGTINYQYKWTSINSVNTYEAIPDTVNFPIITEVYDINNNGIIDFPNNGTNVPFGTYNCSLSSHPNAVVAPDGAITLFYSSISEGTEGVVGTEHRAFRNIWVTHKSVGAPNNFTWATPYRIAEDDYVEEVWPTVSPVLTRTGENHYAHLYYQGDFYPGNAYQPTSGNPHPLVENSVFYIKYCLLPVDVKEDVVINKLMNIYPNPAKDFVNISFHLQEASKITVGIYNSIGQQIITSSKQASAGEVNLSLNIESLPKGVYLLKVTTGKETFTDKLIVH